MWEAVAAASAIGGFFGAVLAFAGRKLQVESDPRVEKIIELLPGANCGSCGFPGCAGFAAAVAEGRAPAGGCNVCGAEARRRIAEIMGVSLEAEAARRLVARIACSGCAENRADAFVYNGVRDCHLAAKTLGAPGKCNFGCFGFGSCVQSCPFGAISIGKNGIAEFDSSKCTGCGVCVSVCPQRLIQLYDADAKVQIKCNNRNKGKAAMEVCRVSCISCGLCVRSCPKQAISLADGPEGSLPVIDYEKCVGCGICAAKCPRRCIHTIKPAAELKITPDNGKKNSMCGACPFSEGCGNKQ